MKLVDYETAQALQELGYDGEFGRYVEEWYEALATMPSTVQRAAAVASTADRMDAAVDRLAAMTDVVADMHQGKSAVADMLRLKGIELPDSATYADIVEEDVPFINQLYSEDLY